MMSDQEMTELNEQVQHTLAAADILTPRERAEQAVSLIGRCVGDEIGGIWGAVVMGVTLPHPRDHKMPRVWWRIW